MNGEFVGEWHRPAGGGQQFLYAESWLSSENARPISLSLPLRPSREPYRTGVEAFFDNLLPDNRGEANRPTRAKTGQRKLIKPSWTEFVRLADQAIVALAGADMINRAEPRACGYSRRSRRLDKKWPETGE
jgi:HipA-like protein